MWLADADANEEVLAAVLGVGHVLDRSRRQPVGVPAERPRNNNPPGSEPKPMSSGSVVG